MRFAGWVFLVVLPLFVACSSGKARSTAAADGGSDSVAGGPPPSGGNSEFTVLIAQYPTWKQRTDRPVSISAEIFGLCRLPTLPEQTFADSEHGRSRFLLDWLNPGAVAGFADGGRKPFPAGAAIVKEKLVGAAVGFELAARGIMIKRLPGFDPAHGDWEFAYWEPSTGILTGVEQSQYCGGCHAGAAATDWIFFDDSWRRP